MKNNKIKNASPLDFDGIHFRSVFECDAYKELLKNGFSPQYEVEKVVLFKGFRPRLCWYKNGIPRITKKGNVKKELDITYTPDFKLEINGYNVYLEVKGFPNDVYPYKRKMFLYCINDKPSLFFEINNMNGLRKTIELLKDANTFTKN